MGARRAAAGGGGGVLGQRIAYPAATHDCRRATTASVRSSWPRPRARRSGSRAPAGRGVGPARTGRHPRSAAVRRSRAASRAKRSSPLSAGGAEGTRLEGRLHRRPSTSAIRPAASRSVSSRDPARPAAEPPGGFWPAAGARRDRRRAVCARARTREARPERRTRRGPRPALVSRGPHVSRVRAAPGSRTLPSQPRQRRRTRRRWSGRRTAALLLSPK